ncbi:hypothetical protein [Mucilaginibacter sp. L3T2-6]|uniref:hypothetical protein n=1 Tax=Mucilaginibacter sp. L3T2-6 TaxID=3062491 RepID=UPI0026757AA9|nr:hypothetical protein [Mucilaginibacter sp. L3T2-6]MDO3644157.1 hypothetical protein [Mucilaginibacter sp. L3T2-6]MDV6216562.1 hypothetical protein [Mucilaginibacter sp. L3T2-6]
MANYLISIPNSGTAQDGTIHDPSSKLKVKVVRLLQSTIGPLKGEKRFFVDANGEMLAFETKGYNQHRELLILHMIAWYCLYLGLIEAQIHSSLPLAV